MSKGKFSTGTFHPKNPEKYQGKGKITWRSSWEQRFMSFCDENRNVKAWASEGIKIPYIDPITGKKRHYIPDFLIQYVDKNGKEITELVEIKPMNQTSIKAAGRSKRNQYAAVINEAKWKSAENFCKQSNINFRILTEQDLFINNRKG